MGAYFLKINRLSAASLQSLHRRFIISLLPSLRQLHVPAQSIVQGDLTNTAASTTTTPSTQWDLHLSVTSTFGNRTLSTSSSKWKTLRKEVILRDDRTCSSCGYLSPYTNGRYMVVDHVDGDASNNDLSNLRVHCPPCDAIRHCGFSGLQEWITVSESTMEKLKSFARLGRFLRVKVSFRIPIASTRHWNLLTFLSWSSRIWCWSRRGRIYQRSSNVLEVSLQCVGGGLFRKIMLTGTTDTYVCFLHFK